MTKGESMIDLKQSVQYVKGVGPNRVKVLNSVGIRTLEDLIRYLQFDSNVGRIFSSFSCNISSRPYSKIKFLIFLQVLKLLYFFLNQKRIQ